MRLKDLIEGNYYTYSHSGSDSSTYTIQKGNDIGICKDGTFCDYGRDCFEHENEEYHPASEQDIANLKASILAGDFVIGEITPEYQIF